MTSVDGALRWEIVVLQMLSKLTVKDWPLVSSLTSISRLAVDYFKGNFARNLSSFLTNLMLNVACNSLLENRLCLLIRSEW
jgi:hypothetical protein